MNAKYDRKDFINNVARVELNYSDKTASDDIYHVLKRAFNKINTQKESLHEKNAPLPPMISHPAQLGVYMHLMSLLLKPRLQKEII